jgi:hypothetical protein
MSGKKSKRRVGAIMNRSDIPYAQRMAMKLKQDIVVNREHSAKITLFCMSISMNRLYGIGYKRLVRFSHTFKKINDEFYDDIEIGMAHAKRRMEQIGMPISGEFFSVALPGTSKREQKIQDHSLHAVQIALICGTIAINESLGFGKDKLIKIHEMVNELTARYAKEGEAFLLEEMRKLGFLIIDNTVICCVDEYDNPVSAKKAIAEGYLDAYTSGKRCVNNG